MEEIDRISFLPNCLLHQILAYLTTKESVQTSILSKRWIHVWKSVPRINLDASDFSHVVEFENFVNTIFAHKLFPRPEKLDTFSFNWQNCTEENYQIINIWIYNLVPMKPKMVHLSVSELDNIYFVSYLFDCPTLENLFLWPQMDGSWSEIIPEIINLPFLQSLNLGWVSLEDEFIQKLISGCPNIEELIFENCFLGVTEKITSNSLKKFVILNTVFGEETYLWINMPNLEHLRCQVHLDKVYFENLISLEYASVNLYGCYSGEETKVLRGLSNAKSLQLLGAYGNIMLGKEGLDLPVFEKLESLELNQFSINMGLEPINLFLRRTPNLKKLTLQHINFEKLRDLQWGNMEIECGKLKSVEIVSLKSVENVHELVNLLFGRFNGIENISINRVDEIDQAFFPQFP